MLVTFAAALAGWGVHGLLQRDTAQRSDRAAQYAAEQDERSTTPEAAARETHPVVRSKPLRADATVRYLPPSGFDPEFRDVIELDPDYALFLEELEAREEAEDEEAELYAETETGPELSDAELEALDDAELARELETYDAFLAELAEDRAMR